APLPFWQRAYAVMRGQESGGSILFITSGSAIRPSPGTAAYGAAKAGLVSLAASLAAEWAPRVRVNCVMAGLVRTELSHLHYGDADGLARVATTIPLGRLAEPRDVGDACLYLASPLAAYVTRSTPLVHGRRELPAVLAAARGRPAAGCAPDAWEWPMVRLAALLLTLLTGLTALVYEVAWQKYLATLLGSDSEATAAVLAIFLGGLAAGYALFGRATQHLVARAR